MSSLDLAKITLNNTRNSLKEGKAEIVTLLKDPKIASWQQINFEKHVFILKILGISAQKIAKTLKDYPKFAKEISKTITRWDNEVGNQLADLVGNKNPDEALHKAQVLEAEAAELDELKGKLQQQLSIFLESDQKIRQSLSLQALIPIAEKSPGVKANLFKPGLETLCLVTDEVSTNVSQKSISQISSEAKKLETRFANIDLPRVPRLGEEILFRQISIGQSTIKEVITFIDSLKGRLAGEVSTLEQIKMTISELYALDTLNVLQGIVHQANSLGALITGLYHKRQLQKNIDTIEETLEYLNIYHLTLKNKIMPALEETIDDPSSKLNPTTISARKTKDFFVGAKGIIRSVKMMVTSLKGHEGVNEIELQVILETALNKCSVYYGKDPKDVKKLRDFIHGLIENYLRPFPYDDLFAMTKHTIATYGGLIERFVKKFDIPTELKSLTTVSIPGTFGALFIKLNEKRTTFRKANAGK